jgi:hypothetical protein
MPLTLPPDVQAWVIEHGGAMREFLRLLHCSIHHCRMCMTDRDAYIHTQQVDVFSFSGVPQVLHGTSLENKRIFKGYEFTLRGRVLGIPPFSRSLQAPICYQS